MFVKRIRSVIKQLEHGSLRDAFIYNAIRLPRATLCEKEELASMIGNSKLRSKALVSLMETHPQMDPEIRRQLTPEIENLITTAIGESYFLKMLGRMYQLYRNSSIPDTEALEMVWNLAQNNKDMSIKALKFLFDKNLDLALSKCEELPLTKDLIHTLEECLSDNLDNLNSESKARIARLIQRGFDSLDETAEDHKLMLSCLLEVLGHLDLEAAWEKFSSSILMYDNSIMVHYGKLAAQQGNEGLIDLIFQKALEKDQMLHRAFLTADITSGLEEYIPDRVFEFINSLDSEAMRGDCLIQIAQRNLRKKNVDRAWQIVSMVKHSGNLYPPLETAYHYESVGKENYLDIGHVSDEHIEETVEKIQGSNIPDFPKATLTDHFLHMMFRPDTALKLARQYMPGYPFAYFGRQLLPVYFHMLAREGWDKAYSYIEENRIPPVTGREFKEFLFWYRFINGGFSAVNFPLLLDYDSPQMSQDLDAFARETVEMLGHDKGVDNRLVFELFDQEELKDYRIALSGSVLLRHQPLTDQDMEILRRISDLLTEEEYEKLFSTIIRTRHINADLAEKLIQEALNRDLPIVRCRGLIRACWEVQPALTLELIKQTTERIPLDPDTDLSFLANTSHIKEAKDAFYLYLGALEEDYKRILSYRQPSIILSQFCFAAGHVLDSSELKSFISMLEKFCSEMPTGQEKDRLLDLMASLVIPLDPDRGYNIMQEIDDMSEYFFSLRALADADKNRMISFVKQHMMIDGRYIYNNVEVFRNAIVRANLPVEELMKLYDEIVIVYPIVPPKETIAFFLGIEAVKKLVGTDLGRAIDYVKQGRNELYSALISPMVKISRTDELVNIFEDYQKQRQRDGKPDVYFQSRNDSFYIELIRHLEDKQNKLVLEFLARIIHPSKRLEACIQYLLKADPARIGNVYKRIFEVSIHLSQIRDIVKGNPHFPVIIMRTGLEKLSLDYVTMKMIENKNLGIITPLVLSLWMCKAFDDRDFEFLLKTLIARIEGILARENRVKPQTANDE